MLNMKVAALVEPDFKAIFTNSPDLYLILSPDLHIVAVTDAYLNATMTKREEILGRHIFDVFPDNPQEAGATGTTNLRSSLERVVKEKVPDTMALQKYDIRKPEADGGTFETRYWSPINSPIFDEDNELLYVNHRVKDVTEYVRLKHLENEQSQLREALKNRTDVMEAELINRATELQTLNKKLNSSNASLQIANEEMEAFSSSVSHDLRAPLRSMIGFSQILIDDYGDKIDEKAKKNLLRIIESSKKMGLLIDGLLKLSRVSRGDLAREDVALSTIAEHILNDLQAAEPARKVEVVIGRDINTVGDSQLLQVALTNLLSNAWKFTSKVVEARIEFSAEEVNGSKVYTVKDNGAGFDMRYANKLFGVFQRLHSPKDFDGIGIGLVSVQRIIGRHGGKIWAEAEPDKGARFCFTLGTDN